MTADTAAQGCGHTSPDETSHIALEIRKLVQWYGGHRVLDLPEWRVERGAHTLIIGPSGCGKSTLLHLIAGLIQPSSGTLVVEGQDLSALQPVALDRFRGERIGIVLQSMHLITALSVRDNLRLARWLGHQPPSTERIDQLLEQLGLMHVAQARPHRLSQGERQRVAIARAVVNGPSLVLADEPTSALDDANCDAVIELLRQHAVACNATLLVATHDHRLQRHFHQQLALTASP
ncbi:MAG: ATP-binding cassette domain-containing protein [Pseudomonadota bacterium]